MKKEIKNILIVDDEEDICFLIKSILKRKSSARIDICTSVKDAIKKLSFENYDLTFFDMRLNDGTGADLVDYVQNNLDSTPYVAVISAYTSSEDMKYLADLNINQFIPKPLSREKIIDCYVNASS